MAVLLLLFLYQGRQHEGWVTEFGLLTCLLLGSLLLLRLIPEDKLARPWFTSGLFIGDALAHRLEQ